MRWKFDPPAGRELYARRMGTVEPVFGNLQNKGMRRFTLRGRRKVNAQLHSGNQLRRRHFRTIIDELSTMIPGTVFAVGSV